MAKKVVGIDPHPSKKATIYDPSARCWESVEARKLPRRVSDMARSDEDLLICWDAPLTMGRDERGGGYYVRPIERFFRSFEKQQKQRCPPKGISVQPYTGCPHWAVTMASLGLPRVGTTPLIRASCRLNCVQVGTRRQRVVVGNTLLRFILLSLFGFGVEGKMKSYKRGSTRSKRTSWTDCGTACVTRT